MNKKVVWVGDSHKVLSGFPLDVKKEIGFALRQVQNGETPFNSCPLLGFGSSKVPEIWSDHNGDTFRAVYTVKFADTVYVLHAFQKKSKRGRKTNKSDMQLVQQRLKQAEDHYKNSRAKIGKERANV